MKVLEQFVEPFCWMSVGALSVIIYILIYGTSVPAGTLHPNGEVLKHSWYCILTK